MDFIPAKKGRRRKKPLLIVKFPSNLESDRNIDERRRIIHDFLQQRDLTESGKYRRVKRYIFNSIRIFSKTY